MNGIWLDLRSAARSLRRTRAWTLLALGVLALGFGATTAVFGFVDAALWRPRPYDEPQRLVLLRSRLMTDGTTTRVSYPDFEEWRARASSFERMASAGALRLTLLDEGSAPEAIVGEAISDGYFDVFGVTPPLGRFIESEERDVIVLSESLWRRRFGARSDVVGTLVRTDEGAFEVVGVAPRGFKGVMAEVCVICQEVDFWVAAPAAALVDRARRDRDVVARLRVGASLESADAEMATVAADLRREHPAVNRGVEALVEPVAERWRAGLRPGLTALMGASVLLLLIAGTNVATLWLSRGVGRRREMAIRVSLGASPLQLLRLHAAENLVLAVTSGAAGGGLALWLTATSTVPQSLALPRGFDVAFGAYTFAFVFAMALVTGVALAIPPALAARPSIRPRRRYDGWPFVVGETALVFALLVGSLLLLQSYRALDQADPGFDTAELALVEIQPSGPRYETAAQRRAFLRELTRGLFALPGGDATTVVSPNLPPRTFVRADVAPVGRDVDTPEGTLRVVVHRVWPNFFDALGIPIQDGRGFDDLEAERQELDVIVSESLARRLWPGETPLGKRLEEKAPRLATGGMRVIGVARDVKYEGFRSDRAGDFDLYLSLQQTTAGYYTIAVRGEAALAPVRDALAAIDPELPVLVAATVEKRFRSAHADSRIQAIVATSFALLAFLLAASGIYAVIQLAVSARAKELAIRLALGCAPGTIAVAIVGRTLRLAAAGIAFGSALSLLLSGLLSNALFAVRTHDATSYVAAFVVVAVISLTASYLPARRASRIDPARSLKAE